MDNPLHQIIYDHVVKPSLDKISRDTEGIITEVDYATQTVSVRWRDHNGGLMKASDVPIPIDGNGVYRQSIKIGTRVRLAFAHGDHSYPYISLILRNAGSYDDYRNTNGASIMRGTPYILGGD
jgi:hypothetical protein